MKQLTALAICASETSLLRALPVLFLTAALAACSSSTKPPSDDGGSHSGSTGSTGSTGGSGETTGTSDDDDGTSGQEETPDTGVVGDDSGLPAVDASDSGVVATDSGTPNPVDSGEPREASSPFGNLGDGGVNQGGCVPAATALVRTGWTATATHSEQDSMSPEKALDGEIATRWSLGQPMADNADPTQRQAFQIDMKTEQSVCQLEIYFDNGGGDHLPKYEIHVFNEASDFTTPVATGEIAGGYPVKITLPPGVKGRFVGIVNRGDSGAWWTMQEVNVFPAAM